MAKFSDREINVFRAVIATGSVSAAGERLNLSQPSISRHLGDLERKFGCALFTRHGRGVRPTPEARVFDEAIEQKLAVMTALEDTAEQILNKQHGVLTVGANIGFSVSIVPQALRKLRAGERSISVTLQIKSSQRIIDYVRNGTIDAGIVHMEHLPESVRILENGEVPYCAIFTASHPLARNTGPIKLQDLNEDRVVGMSENIGQALKFQRIGLNSQSPVTTNVSISTLAVAEALGAVPIVDAFMATYWASQRDIVVRPIRSIPGFKYMIIQPNGQPSSLVASDLVERLKAETSRVRTAFEG